MTFQTKNGHNSITISYWVLHAKKKFFKILTTYLWGIAFKIILQPIEKTFTDEDIEKISEKIIELVSKNFDGKLRQ